MPRFTVKFSGMGGFTPSAEVDALTPLDAVIAANGPSLEGTAAIVMDNVTVHIYKYEGGEWKLAPESSAVASMYALAVQNHRKTLS